MGVIGSYPLHLGFVFAVVRSRNSVRPQMGKPIEVWMTNLADLYAETVLKPLRHQMAMTECFARLAIGCGFPTQHHRIGAKPV
jgi:hypothetical protein